MKGTRWIVVVVMVAAGGAGYAGAQTTAAPGQKKPGAQPVAEKKPAGRGTLQLKDLPPAVRTTVEAETKNATLKGLANEKENGKTVYELETLVNGRTRDLMIDAAGKVYLVEEQLDVDKAPAPVRAALEKKGKIVVLESVVQNGTTHYEGQVQPPKGKKIILELNADGTPVKK